MSDEPEFTRTVVIRNKYGLHARPAAEFVKTAGRFRAQIYAAKDETEVDGKSIMGVMMLAAECGSELRIRTQGIDAEQAMIELVALVENGFGEE